MLGGTEESGQGREFAGLNPHDVCVTLNDTRLPAVLYRLPLDFKLAKNE